MPRLLLVALVLLFLAPGAAWALDPAELEGKWVQDDEAANIAARDAAVDEAAGRFPYLVQGLVRKRLAEAVEIREFFRFAWSDPKLTISTELGTGWTTELDGSAVDITSKKGESLVLSRRVEGGRLVSRVEAGRGVTTWTYRPVGDVLEVEVSVESKKLGDPVRYLLRYRR